MSVCVFSVEKVFGNQEVYDIIIAFLNIPAIQFLVDSFHECSVHSNGVLRRDCRTARGHVCDLQRDVRQLLPLARAAAEAAGGTLVEDPLVLRVPEAIPELES